MAKRRVRTVDGIPVGYVDENTPYYNDAGVIVDPQNDNEAAFEDRVTDEDRYNYFDD